MSAVSASNGLSGLSGGCLATGAANASNANTALDNKELLMLSLAKFYKNNAFASVIMPIIEGKSEVSLRLIDWFVTNYSKKYGTILQWTEDDGTPYHFNVYINYRLQLKAYSKHQFDPFRRRDRILFYFNKDDSIETTIGQLNFFKWVLQNKILEYIDENKQKVEDDMVQSQKDNSVKRLDSDNIKVKFSKNEYGETVVTKRKKRNELSKSFVQNMNQFVGRTMVSFD